MNRRGFLASIPLAFGLGKLMGRKKTNPKKAKLKPGTIIFVNEGKCTMNTVSIPKSLMDDIISGKIQV